MDDERMVSIISVLFFFVQKIGGIGEEFAILQKLLPQSQPNMAYTWYHLLPYQAP